MFNFTQMLHRNIQHRPTQDAIRYRDKVWSFEEMGDRVARLAGGLQTIGMNEGDLVAMLSLNSAAFLEYQYAIPWGGGALNPVNIRWSASEIAYSLEDSGTAILIVDDTYLPLVDDIRAKAPVLKTIIHVGEKPTPEGLLNYEELIANASPVDDAHRCGDDIYGVFYTGGTTGFPKGVMLSHTNIMTSTASIALVTDVEEGGAYMHAAPMFHAADLALGTATMLRGCTHVIVPAFDPADVFNTLAEQAVSDVLLVPTMVQMLLAYDGFDGARLSSLKRIFYGASPMPLATLEKALRLLPNVRFTQVYGMTELSPVATCSPHENHIGERAERGLIKSAGRSALLQQVKIVDEQDNEMPRGEVGEIIVRGANVMLGYLNKPEATAEALRGGWMHTGDMGYMDDEGWIFVVDRNKDMIITGGENVYSAEVESVLSRHPAVAQVAVIAVPSEEWGEMVHAVVVPAAGKNPTLESLREFARESIASYKCPRSLELVEALPLSGAGKVQKNELRKKHWGGRDKGVS